MALKRIFGGKSRMIVYYKLANILKERNMQWKDLCNSGISTNMPQKFSQNKSVTTETIDKVCTYLHIQPSDMMEWVEDERNLRKRELETQIKALQQELDGLK